MLGDSSKSWGVPRLHPLHNSCIPIWAEPLCFLNTPLPSSVHFTGDAVKALVSVTPAALNSAAGAIPYQQKQSLLGRKGKRGTNELKTEQRPRCHGMSPKVSTSFRSHPSFLFLKGDCCFKIEMERNAWTHYPLSAVQQLHTGRCQKVEAGDQSRAGHREEPLSSFTDQIYPSGKQPRAHPPSATKGAITAPKF